jgi:hypothetical protein
MLRQAKFKLNGSELKSYARWILPEAKTHEVPVLKGGFCGFCGS